MLETCYLHLPLLNLSVQSSFSSLCFPSDSNFATNVLTEWMVKILLWYRNKALSLHCITVTRFLGIPTPNKNNFPQLCMLHQKVIPCCFLQSSVVFSRNKIRRYHGHETEKKIQRLLLVHTKKCTISLYFILLLKGKSYFHLELNTSLYIHR